MSVPPHPHTGLQTVSWLFTGEIEHRDSAGNHAMVRPGELNLMTAGHGISHSEVSTAGTTQLHGAQLWVALPEAARDGAPGFDHYAPPEVAGDGWAVRVFLGSLLGSSSPVATATPLLGAEVLLDAGTALEIDLDPAYEHGVLVDSGVVRLDESEVKAHELAYLAPDSPRLTLEAGDSGARVLLLGGEPFGEPIVMWWNFVGRTHEEVVAYREAWQGQVLDDAGAEQDPVAAGGLQEASGPQRVVHDGQQVRPGRFGVVVGEHLPPIPAPPLPNARLKERS
jgi:redox-sensitive bicupin YhaK (pirin superfamily)